MIGARDGWLVLRRPGRGWLGRRPSNVPVGPDDLYHIRFSSGSTGKPKGIAISQRGARAAMLGNTWVMSTSGPTLEPRTLQVAPLVYAGGWSVLPTLVCGGTNVDHEALRRRRDVAGHRGRAHHLDVRRADDAATGEHVVGAATPARSRPLVPDACRRAGRHPCARSGERAHRRHGAVLGPDRGSGLDDVPEPERDGPTRAVVVDRASRPGRRVLAVVGRDRSSTDRSPASTASS